MTIFILLAAGNFLLGAGAVYFVQAWFPRKRKQPAAVVAIANAASPSASVAESNSSPHSAWLASLVEKVEGDISRHAFEIDELAEELAEVPPDEPSSIMAAAAAMLVANRRLQADLETANFEIQKQRQKVDLLTSESRTDPLTGLANRRCFDEELARRFDQWRRHKVPISLLLVDVDHFKHINDQYGHPVGDSVLRWVAGIPAQSLRPMDVAARYGGEEFGVILPGTKLADAMNVAERLRATIAAKAFSDGDVELPVTVSIGLAVVAPDDAPALLVMRADEALYAAKQTGRNRACLHNGFEPVVIEIDSGLVRHPFDTVQQVAVYRGGAEIPSPDEFSRMRSCDISAKGISLISESAPICKAFVVQLGSGARSRYMVANISNVTALSSDPPHYRIGCAFIARLEPSDDPACEPLEEPQAISA